MWIEDIDGTPRKSCLFLLTNGSPWNKFSLREGLWFGKGFRFLGTLVQYHQSLKIQSMLNFLLFVLITASGLQGE